MMEGFFQGNIVSGKKPALSKEKYKFLESQNYVRGGFHQN